MKKNIHKANSRGVADLGWLYSFHTYSFSSYHNPERVHFGALRVLNDDLVSPGMGFGTHGHQDMEIVSIPISGKLAHKDNTGIAKTIEVGEVQIMSAGTGIRHSEFNESDSSPVNFLQIWILPKLKGITPRYEQKRFTPENRKNQFQVVVSPEKNAESVWINQDSYFSLLDLDKGNSIDYNLYQKENGVYIFLIEGKIRIDDLVLEKRDGIEISEIDKIQIVAEENSEILCMEVPFSI
jgi:quercetin 2,3-dioxygenase